MALDAQTIAGLAEHLETCELQARDTPKITDEHPAMDWDDAYAIQDEILRRKLSRGARLIGLKAGLTSHAKMKQMSVNTPVFGFLVDRFSVPEGAEIKVSELIHPKVEPEIAFVLKRALKGPGCHIGAVLAATDFVLPGKPPVIVRADLLEPGPVVRHAPDKLGPILCDLVARQLERV